MYTRGLLAVSYIQLNDLSCVDVSPFLKPEFKNKNEISSTVIADHRYLIEMKIFLFVWTSQSQRRQKIVALTNDKEMRFQCQNNIILFENDF